MGTRLSNGIGLSRKAGKCIGGDFAVEKAVRAGKALLVLLDGEASENTRDKYTFLCRGRDVPLLITERPGDAAGMPGRMVLAVTDAGFKKMIEEAYNSEK